MANGLDNSSVLKAVGPTTFAHCDNGEAGSMIVLKGNLPVSDLERRRNSHWAIMNVRVYVVPPKLKIEAETLETNRTNGNKGTTRSARLPHCRGRRIGGRIRGLTSARAGRV